MTTTATPPAKAEPTTTNIAMSAQVVDGKVKLQLPAKLEDQLTGARELLRTLGAAMANPAADHAQKAAGEIAQLLTHFCPAKRKAAK
jgi:hypothetical protein